MGRYSGALERDDSALRRALRVTVSRQTESADRHCSWIKRRFYHPMVLGQLPNAQKPTCRLPRRAQKLRVSGQYSGWNAFGFGPSVARSRNYTLQEPCYRPPWSALAVGMSITHLFSSMRSQCTTRATNYTAPRSSMTHAWDLTSVRRTRSKHDKHAQKR